MHIEPNKLNAFLDGELPPADAAAVEAHLAGCPACAALVVGDRATGDRLRAAPLPVPSMDAHLRWLSQWQIARDRSVRRLAGWMTAAAAVVLGVTLSTTFVGPAQAQPALAEWEAAAFGSMDDDDAPRTARLFAVDLALPLSAEASQ
ncbi:MAG TPA: zf-HC2 domain-containing protein [Tepidisphaeraceae bacterium]|jgi:anti-sigma factor RsiW